MRRQAGLRRRQGDERFVAQIAEAQLGPLGQRVRHGQEYDARLGAQDVDLQVGFAGREPRDGHVGVTAACILRFPQCANRYTRLRTALSLPPHGAFVAEFRGTVLRHSSGKRRQLTKVLGDTRDHIVEQRHS